MCALFDNGPGMLLCAVTSIAAAIVNASHLGGDGLEGQFEERRTGVDCIDTNDLSIESPFRAHNRLSERPGIRFHAGFHAGGQIVIGHRKATTLQRLGGANLAEARTDACAA